MEGHTTSIIDRILAVYNDGNGNADETSSIISSFPIEEMAQEISQIWIGTNPRASESLCMLIKVNHTSINSTIWSQLLQFLTCIPLDLEETPQNSPCPEILSVVTKEAIKNLSQFKLEACVQGLAQIAAAFQSGLRLCPIAFELFGAMMASISNVGKFVMEVDSASDETSDEPAFHGSSLHRELSGQEYTAMLIRRILSNSWSPTIPAVNIISTLSEVDMSVAETEIFTNRILQCFPISPDHDKPKIAHTLILLTKRGDKTLILTALSNMLSAWSKSTENTSMLPHRIIGSILTNVSFAMRHDQTLCESFLKWIREDHVRLFADYNFAIVLLITHVPRFEFMSLDIMTTAIQIWIEAMGCAHSIRRLLDSSQNHSNSLSVQIDTLLKSSSFDESGITDQIVGSLLKLGCHILDSPSVAQKKKSDVIQLTRMLFKSESSMRAVMVFELLCADTVRMQSHASLIKEMIGNIYAIPGDVCKRFLAAIAPLVVCDRPLFDCILLVLRKGSFQREFALRDIALDGLLHLLANMDKLGSDQAPELTTKFELIGYLRRFLSQQLEIRERLYAGLLNLACSNPSLANNVMSIIWTQLEQYLESNGEGLKFELCFTKKHGTDVLVESVGVLIHTCSVILSKTIPPEAGISENKLIGNTLLRMIGTYTKLRMEDLQLDENSTMDGLEVEMGVLEKKQTWLQTISSVYEAMLGHCFLHGDGSEEWSGFVVNLFKRLQELKGALKDLQPKGRYGLKEKRVGCILSFQVCAPIICKVLENSHTSSDMSAFILSAASGQLSQMLKCSTTLITKGFLDDCKSMANTIYRVFLDRKVQITQCDKKLFILAVDCFERSYLIAQRLDDKQLLEWLVHVLDIAIENNTDTTSTDVCTNGINGSRVGLGTLDALKATLQEQFSLGSYSKQALAIFRCVALVAKRFPIEGVELKEWLVMTVFQQPILDSASIKEVFELFLHSTCIEDDSKLLQKIATDTALQFGSIVVDDDTQDEDQPQSDFLIICQESSSSIALCMLGFLETSLEQIEWCFVHSSSFALTIGHPFSPLEDRLMKRLVQIIIMVGEFENACIPSTVSDTLLRCIGKAYRLLTTIAKMVSLCLISQMIFICDSIAPPLSPPAQRIHDDIILSLVQKLKEVTVHLSDEFIILVKAASANLTQRLYCLIPYLQQRDGEALQNKKKQKGKQHLGNDTKMIPNVIYHIEQYERHLIQLCKHTKIDLAQFIKVSFPLHPNPLSRVFDHCRQLVIVYMH
ncbi:hypothetical protein BASA62_010233 [Batrachochytrium salamandrivorans]|nr:hypothetical protein BASA62_010233 [Batrachochytrium salamandrivorans]